MSATGGNRPGNSRRESEIRYMANLLQELRVILPGVQVTFAFLLTVAFTERFSEETAIQRGIYFAALLSTALATVFFIAPTIQHRLLWRQGQRAYRLRTANVLFILGTILLAVAMSCVIFLVSDVVYGRSVAIVATGVMLVVLAELWYLQPLQQRARS